MNFDKFFRFISYSAVFCGFLSLWVSGSFGVIGSGLFIAFIIAAWFLEGTKWQLSEKVGTTLIVAAVPVYYLLSRFMPAPPNITTNAVVLVGLLSRLIITLTAIKLLQKKSDRDWIFLYLMAFFEVLLAAGLSISALYLATFVLYLLVMVCTIIAFEIRKTARRVVEQTSGLIKNEDETQAESTVSIRRLPAMAVGLIAVIACIGLPLFFFLPRVGGAGLGSSGTGVSVRSGFSDVVKLGSGVGSIQQNDEIVMRVRLDGVTGEQPDLYWRGLALDTFDGKTWERSSRGADTYARGEREIIPLELLSNTKNVVRQTIYLEPLDTSYLFGLPKVAGIMTSLPALQKDSDGDISAIRPQERISYRVISDRSTPSPEALRNDEKKYSAETARFLQLPENIDSRIAELAAEITRGKTNRYDKAAAIEEYLQTQFGYTLELKAGGADPLADFLFNVRQGHCEYFATAMAIMLRTQGIATRVVNGFHQGDYNDAVDTYVVRQKNAHSWVEVYFPKEDAWVKFDPTPPAGQTAPSSIAGITGRINKYLEALETYWIQYFVAYDNQEQRSLARTMRTGFTGYQQSLSAWAENVKAVLASWWSEVRGDLGAGASATAIGKGAGLVALIVAAVLLVWWLIRDIVKSKVWRRIADWFYGRRAASIVEFYDRMQKILASKGWVREPHQTPLEFAYAVGMSEAVNVTEKYNRVRFGEKDISSNESNEIERWLEEISATNYTNNTNNDTDRK
jgi:transglutaminase-like putative cysteine protease